jgi:transposase
MRRKKPPNRGGRPSKLTMTVALSLVAGARKYHSCDEVARSAGLGPATLYRWLARGRRGDPTYKVLFDAVREARGALANAVREARAAARAKSDMADLAYALFKRGF